MHHVMILPPPPSTGLGDVLRVSFHITPSVQEAIAETRRSCHRVDHARFLCLRLVLFYQKHLYLFMFFVLPLFPPTCPLPTVHFYIVSFWSCPFDLGECFQSPVSGRQTYIYHGIYSFALYILFLSSSQTSSSTSSSSSSASISPASTPCL